MKIVSVALLFLSVAPARFALARQSSASAAIQGGAAATALVPESTAAELSPAEQRIDAAKREIAADAKKPQAFNDLAAAYLKRARETADRKYLDGAEEALKKGFALDAGDFQLQKTQVALMLARGEFAPAKEKAAGLNRRMLDDVMVYGYLAEAEIGLGDYSGAETNAQWMLNMLPNNVPGLLIGAKLRVHYGDPDGAIEFLNLAYTETSPTEVEDLAWIANQIASIEIDSGKIEQAKAILDRAEETFPNYAYTLKNLERARQAQRGTNVAAPDPTAKPAESSAGEAIAEAASAQQDADAASVPMQHEIDDSGGVFPAVRAELLTPRASETDRLIHKAQARAANNPEDAKAYAALGAAYFQRARETGDVGDYEMAEKSLSKSLDISSSDFSAGAAFETLAEVCMGEHRFADALSYAEKALSLGSGDLSPFAIVGDAYADMGEYEKARAAYERLIPRDVEPSPRAAYGRDSRLAYLSFVEGGTQEAIQRMKTSVAEGTEAAIPSENLAWLYYELGEFNTQAGDARAADEAYLAALKIHPGDYRALAGLARLRANHGRSGEAILLYQKAIAVVPMPVFIEELGDLYEKAGNHAEAKKQYDLVEYIGLLGHVNQVLHNRDLALFYADHDIMLDESLVLAQKEFEVRHDIYTWDALAWALYKNGKFAEAAKASDEALKFGTRDSLLLFHAGTISARLGNADRARSQLKAALEINRNFNLRYADAAQKELAVLDGGRHEQESAVSDAR